MTDPTLSERVKAAWKVRREKHGPSGGNLGGERWHAAVRPGCGTLRLPQFLPGAHTHGDRNTYGRYGCRCIHCSDAHREHHRKLRGRRRANLAIGIQITHGSSGYRNHYCRCEVCLVGHYLSKPSDNTNILATRGIMFIDGGFIMVRRARNIYIVSRQMASIRGQILPADFDDDTRVAEATLRYHPPRAWVEMC